MAQLVLAGLCQLRRCTRLPSAAFSRPQSLLGEWTYGRWMMVHMNLELYAGRACPGRLSLQVYGADRGLLRLCRRYFGVSTALAVGAYSWLSATPAANSSDWSGYAASFSAAMIACGSCSLFVGARMEQRGQSHVLLAKRENPRLVLLLAVPSQSISHPTLPLPHQSDTGVHWRQPA